MPKGYPLPDHVVLHYLDLRLAGVPQRDAAQDAGIRQSRASLLDGLHRVPTSRAPDRVPPANPEWKPMEKPCPNCGSTVGVIHAGQRFCPDTRHACSQRFRRHQTRKVAA